MLSVANRTGAHALAQHCCTNLAKRVQHHATSTSLTIFKLEPTTPNMSQHIATWWPNARNMLRPTMWRYAALKCCDRLAWALAWQKSKARRLVWIVQNTVHIANTLTKGTRS